MHKQGSDKENMAPDEFLCDFCHRPWAEDRPMIEGHQGSIICGACLTVAFTAMASPAGLTPADGTKCNLCLETRAEFGPMWQSPRYEEAWVCTRCADQAAETLEEDTETPWSRPK